jgi:peptidoglycan/xylan/chitin deacetylase (PgdA/CDA1 family)
MSVIELLAASRAAKALALAQGAVPAVGLAQAIAAAGGDPTARDAAQRAPQRVASKGKSYFDLVPRKRKVIATFADNAAAFNSSGGTYSTEDFPVPAPNGQVVGAKYVIMNGAIFTGTITGGTTLNVSNVIGTIAIGQTISGPSVGSGRTITAGSGTTWTVTNGPNVANTSMESGTPNATGTFRTNAFSSSAGGGVPSSYGFRPFAKAAGQVIGVLVYIDKDLYQAQYLPTDQIQIRLNRDGSNWHDWFITSAFRLKSGWQMIMLRWDEDGTTGPQTFTNGAMPDGSMITQASFIGQAGSGNFTFRVAEICVWDGPVADPMVMLTFDGWYNEHVTNALPVLQSEGVKATFTTGSAYWMNDASVPNALAAAGMDVGQQVLTHIGYPQQGDASYTSDLKRALSHMRALGFRPEIQSMPYNDMTLSQAIIARNLGVRLAREGRSPGTPILEWGLGSGQINVGQTGLDNATLATMKKVVDAAKRYGDLRVTTMHQVIPGGNGTTLTGSGVQTYQEDLRAFIQYGKAQGVRFVLASELVRSLDAAAAIA